MEQQNKKKTKINTIAKTMETTEKIKIFAKTVEKEAISQIQKMSECEAYKDCKIRIMPDCHAGKGCTIGTVISIGDRVVPNTVGVDIGCGMLVCYLGFTELDLAEIDKRIRERVPSGFNIHNKAVAEYPMLEALHCREAIDIDIANRSIGTLGGGNHFIEINKANDGQNVLVIHSGSRNLGLRVCNYYQKIAEAKCGDKSKIVNETIARLKAEGREKDIQAELRKLPRIVNDNELAYLDGVDAQNYLHDMWIVQEYATLNRREIAHSIIGDNGVYVCFETVHNYIDLDNRILRKGAVRADEDELLIIPMNMRDGSLICRGKGNADWLYSAPHGAGRLMSRKKAKEILTMQEFSESMNGIYTTSVCESTLDEAPMAYKPMQEIIECIEPTVEIVDIIKPIYNFKAQ